MIIIARSLHSEQFLSLFTKSNGHFTITTERQVSSRKLRLPHLCESLLHAVKSRSGLKPLDLLLVERVVQLDVVLGAIGVLQCRDDLEDVPEFTKLS